MNSGPRKSEGGKSIEAGNTDKSRLKVDDRRSNGDMEAFDDQTNRNIKRTGKESLKIDKAADNTSFELQSARNEENSFSKLRKIVFGAKHKNQSEKYFEKEILNLKPNIENLAKEEGKLKMKSTNGRRKGKKKVDRSLDKNEDEKKVQKSLSIQADEERLGIGIKPTSGFLERYLTPDHFYMFLANNSTKVLIFACFLLTSLTYNAFDSDFIEFEQPLPARNFATKNTAPVVIVPGMTSSNLEVWQSDAFTFRSSVWGCVSILQGLLKNRNQWHKHIQLGPGGTDPPGIKVRATQGISAIDFTMFWVWGKILQNLAVLGYDNDSLHVASYDWRLGIDELEERDKYFTKLKAYIELQHKVNDKKVVVVAHSLGGLISFYFLQWVGSEWISEHLKCLVTIGTPFLGTPKSLSAVLSGEARETVESTLFMRAMDVFFGREERKSIFRTWNSLKYLLPKGGQRFWKDMVTFGDSACDKGVKELLASHVGKEYTISLEKTINISSECVGREKKNWGNPLVCPLPDVKDFEIYCFYGVGNPSEVGYVYEIDRKNAWFEAPKESFFSFINSSFSRLYEFLSINIFFVGVNTSISVRDFFDRKMESVKNFGARSVILNSLSSVFDCFYTIDSVLTAMLKKAGISIGQLRSLTKLFLRIKELCLLENWFCRSEEKEEQKRPHKTFVSAKETLNQSTGIPNHPPPLIHTAPDVKIASSYTDSSKRIFFGVRICDGDGTVPLLSAGYMGVRGWRTQTLNPHNIKIVVREYRHQPQHILRNLRGGPDSSEHVDILGNHSVIADLMKVLCYEELDDRIVSEIVAMCDEADKENYAS